MRLLAVKAENFLSYESFALDFTLPLTVITGPNGVGKSNLARCLDMAVSVLRSAIPGVASKLDLDQFLACGHNGASSYTVELDIEFDQDAELRLFCLFVVAASINGLGRTGTNDSVKYDAIIGQRFDLDSLKILLRGKIRISCEANNKHSPWRASWEFGGGRFVIPLVGGQTNVIHLSQRPGVEVVIGNVEQLHPHWLQGSRQDGTYIIQKSLKFDAVLSSLSQGKAVGFWIGNLMGLQTPSSVVELTRLTGVEADTMSGFGFVFATLLDSSVVLTDNRRLPLRRYFWLEELARPVSLRDGSGVAAELYRMKQGAIADRRQFEDVRTTFFRLIGRDLDVRASVVVESSDNSSKLAIEPVVINGELEVPIELSGAGVQEALLLSTLIAGSRGRVVVLDEPAMNLEPTAQRRLLYQLRQGDQLVVVTHSPDLVPVDEPGDLSAVVRLALMNSRTSVFRPGPITAEQAARWGQLLQPTHVRSLLFSKGVILCEGSTEAGALPRWFREAASILNVTSPDEANLAFVDVGGDSGFGAYVDFLDAFGVPWVVICDGPALRNGSKMYKQLRSKYPNLGDGLSRDDFVGWKTAWEEAGVFTLAEEFGDDGTKSAEFEAYIESVDTSAYAASHALFPKSKVRCGANFAATVTCPSAVQAIYALIAKRLLV